MGSNTIVVTKIFTAFPKHIYVSKFCMHIHDLKWEQITKFQEEVNSLTSDSAWFKKMPERPSDAHEWK